jgi:hypothetical protein
VTQDIWTTSWITESEIIGTKIGDRYSDFQQERVRYRQLARGLLRELKSYAVGRKKDVARGAETPELAALLLDKYAWGVASALKLLEFPARNFTAEADRLVLEIDPDFAENRKKRWAARPASLSFAPAEPTALDGGPGN